MKRYYFSLLMVFCLLVQFAGPLLVSAQPGPDEIARKYLMPGETLYTYPYPLRENGQDYYLHILIKNPLSNYEQIIPILPNLIDKGTVTAVLVTTNGQVVEDQAQLNDLLILWQAGYQLYKVQDIPADLKWVDTESFAHDMNRVIYNHLFLPQMTAHLLLGKGNRYRVDAWKGILNSQIDPPAEWNEFGELVKANLEGARPFQTAIDETIAASYFIKGRGNRIPDLLKDARRAYKSWNPDPARAAGYYTASGTGVSGANIIKLFDYGQRLIWITNLRKERAEWIPDYDAMFTESYQRLEPEQREAMLEVYQQAQSDFAQRLDILNRIIVEVGSDKLLGNLAPLALKELLAKKSITVFGTTVTSHAILASLASVSAGLTVADFMYGLSGLYDNFWVALESDLLRMRFQIGRTEIENRSRLQQDHSYYDASLIKKYQIVYMLEALAAAQMIRSYADGIDSTQGGLQDFLNPVNWFQGKERKQAVADLHSSATRGEIAAEETILYPTWVPRAASLSLDRIAALRLTVDDMSPTGFTKKGPEGFWHTVQAGFGDRAFWTKNEAANPSNSAVWSLRIDETGLYRMLAYIPAQVPEISLPYSEAAHYKINVGSTEKSLITSQAAKAGDWLDLGVYHMQAGQTVSVELVDWTGEATGTKAVVFDAIQWLPVPKDELENYYGASQEGLAYDVVSPGETAVLEFIIQNTGLLPWNDGEYALVGDSGNTKDAPVSIAISKSLLPGEKETIIISIPASNNATIISLNYMMERDHQAFGNKFTGIVIILPEQISQLEDTIRQKIEDWQKQGKQKLEELIQQFLEIIQKEIENLARRQFESWCGGSTSMLFFVGFFVVFSARRRPPNSPL